MLSLEGGMHAMNAAIVVATLVLLIQGTRIVIRPGAPPFVRGFGLLTLLLAGLSLVLFAILFWGEAVLSPEFDTVMAWGHWRGLVVLVAGFAVAAGLGLRVQRLKASRPGRLAGLLILGLAVGTAAATRITTPSLGLSGADTAQTFRIYSYDLWWPPLLIWVSACFLDGAITILGVHDRRLRIGAFFAMLLMLSLRARSRRVFTDPTSAVLWDLAVVVAALGGVLLVLWVVWSAPARSTDALQRLRAAARGFVPAMRRAWERAVTGGWPGISAQVWRWLQPMVGQLLAVLALAMIAASLADIFYVGWLPHAGALVVLAIAWTCLAEVTAQGPLRAFVVNVVPDVYERLANQKSWVRHGWLLLAARLASPLSLLGGALRRLVSLRPFPEAIVKIGVLFVGLVVAYEIPHAGKTLLQPFTAVAVQVNPNQVPTLSSQADIGRAVFDHLTNTLGALTHELQPDVILMLPPESERGARFRTLAAGGSGSIDLFLTQDVAVDVGGGVKIPLGLVLRPVLQPLRWLLGVRVVDGSVLAEPQGYTVLVRSSAGEVWRARLANEEVPRELPSGNAAATRSTPDSAFSRLALELAFRIMSAEPALAKFGMTHSWDAFSHFKQGLDSWQEFSVHRGQGDPDTLSEAIQHFRAAIGVDPEFALAHYRLGVALQNDGQPLAAAEALRASLKANPGFVPAMVALASVLYGSEHDLGPYPIGLPTLPDGAAGNTKLQEARHLWQSVISAQSGASSLDRAAAWAGLCRYALDEPERRHQGPDHGDIFRDQSDKRDSLSYRIAYFHCQQAERLYATLFATHREDLRVRTARASELVSIGVLLERHGPRRRARATDDWQCSMATIDEASLATDIRRVRHSVPVSYYTRAALRYYRQALKLLPDDPVLRCHEASAQFAVYGDPRLMQSLEGEAAARWNLAEGYLDEARRHLAEAAGQANQGAAQPDRKRHGKLAEAYFDLALTEYEATLKRDPTNFEALNRYAHVFWEWRRGKADTILEVGAGKAVTILETGPGLEYGRKAESNARRAVAMAEAKQLKSLSQGYDTDTGVAGRPTQTAPIAQAGPADRAPKSSSGRATGDVRDDSIPRHLRPAAVTAFASLGTVLVAQGRPQEAIEMLEYVSPFIPEHPSFDHVRWMLAQAHLCAASKEGREIRQRQREATKAAEDRQRGANKTAEDRQRDAIRAAEEEARLEIVGEHREKARLPLGIIRAHERSRESQPFAQLTDIGRSDRICREEWLPAVTAKKGQPLYELKPADPKNYRALCKWLGVRIEPPDDWTEEHLYLHVWGGGVDERVRVKIPERDLVDGRERVRHHDPISITPTRNRFYYIAQLEDAQYQPVSGPLFLKPPGEGPGSGSPGPAGAKPAAVDSDLVPGAPISGAAARARCPEDMNLLRLTFPRPESPATSTAATD